MSRTAARIEAGSRQIGEVAELVGLSLRTIRYYEEVELVMPSGRSAGGFRLYTDADIERLRLVKSLKPLEFTLEEMRDLVTLRERLAAGAALDDDDTSRLVGYADAAASRAVRLRNQLQAVESTSRVLARQARAARRGDTRRRRS